MRRYLLLPLPFHGHVNPMVPLAAELVKRGETVVVAVSPPFARAFEDSGCQVAELHIDANSRTAPSRPTLWDRLAEPYQVWRMFRERRWLASQLRQMWPVWRPDVVITDIMARWGIYAALTAGTPFVAFHTGEVLNRQVLADDAAGRFGTRVVSPRERLLLSLLHPGLRPELDRAALTVVNLLRQLQPSLESFDGRARFVGPLLRADRSTDDDLPWERMKSSRTLYVSTGTLVPRKPEFFQRIAAGFADTDWLVVMSTGVLDPADLGTLPGNVVVRGHLPQPAVLEHADAFVTHGGANSVMEALAAEVPMVLVPVHLGTELTARRVVALGAGTILAADATGEEFRDTIERVVGDEAVSSSLAELASSCREEGGPAVAADAVQSL